MTSHRIIVPIDVRVRTPILYVIDNDPVVCLFVILYIYISLLNDVTFHEISLFS